jgi:hypothetical protein
MLTATVARETQIPRRIIRVTHDTPDKRAPVLDKIGTLLRVQNPSYEQVEYSLTDLQEAARAMPEVGDRVLRSMNAIQPVAYKVDVFRVGELNVRGGVYLDSKVVPTRPLDALLPAHGGFFPRDCDRAAIWNGIMAFPPKDPVMVNALTLIEENVAQKHYGLSALEPTGPLLVGRAHKKAVADGYSAYYDFMGLSDLGVFVEDWNHDDAPMFVIHNSEYRRHFTLANMCHYTDLYKSRAVYYEAVCDPVYGLPWNTRLGVWDIRVRIVVGVIVLVAVLGVAGLAIIYRRQQRHVADEKFTAVY